VTALARVFSSADSRLTLTRELIAEYVKRYDTAIEAAEALGCNPRSLRKASRKFGFSWRLRNKKINDHKTVESDSTLIKLENYFVGKCTSCGIGSQSHSTICFSCYAKTRRNDNNT